MSEQNTNNKPQPKPQQTSGAPAQNNTPAPAPEQPAKKDEPSQTPAGVKEIRVKLKSPSKIDFIVCNTGERNTRMIHETKFILSKATLFKIPLTDSTLNYSEANLIRLVTPVTESIRILDIVNGIATIEPIVHGSFVEDGQLLGYIY